MTSLIPHNAGSLSLLAHGSSALNGQAVAFWAVSLNHITEFHAYGDGVGDDTAALQEAITYVAATSGKLMSVPGKTYLVSSTLSVTAGCELDFQGSLIKKKSTHSSEAINISGSNVTIRNLVVNGNRSGGATGVGIKTTGSAGLMVNVESSHNATTAGLWINGGDFELRGCKFNDNVQVASSSGDGVYVATAGVVKMDAQCEASNNGRAGIVIETNAGTGCVINGTCKRNGVYGAFIRASGGRSSYLYFEDNDLYGLDISNAVGTSTSDSWGFDYVECVNQGLTANNGVATAVQLEGASFNSFGTIVSRGTPGYALAFSGGGTVGSTYNRVGSILADQTGASNGNPGIIYAAGSASGSKHNHIGTMYVKNHTVAVNFGETVNGGNDHNSIGFLHADSCTYGVMWIGNGSYNRVDRIVSRDCYTTDAGVPRALISFINTTTTTDNVVGLLDHATTSGITKPIYLVSYAAGTLRNRVLEIHCPAGDYQTAVYTDSGTNDIHPDFAVAPLKPAAALYESIPRQIVNGDITALATGQLTLFGCYLPAGTKVTSITLVSGATPLNTGANQWFALYDNALAKLGVTSDDTSTAWAATTAKTLNLASPYTTTYDGLYYIGCMVKATTPPSLAGAAVQGGVTALTPKLAGLSSAGLTNPASAPNPAAAITSFGATVYAYVS